MAKTVFDTNTAKEYLRLFDNVSMDGEKLREEIVQLHERRKKRSALLNRQGADPHRIREAVALDVAIRSRIVGIQLRVNKVLDNVERVRDAVVVKLIALYGSKLPTKNVVDTRTYLKSGLDDKLVWLGPLLAARDAAKYVIEDIDKAAWSLRLMYNTFEIDSRPENTL